MKALNIFVSIILISCLFYSCKENNNSNPTSATVTNSGDAAITGFWTYKEDAANDYWNANVLFKNDGTFRMYQALSLADTSAVRAIADTANQVVTFGTYTVNGKNVKMIYTEFNVINFKFTGTLNNNSNILIGNLDSNEPGSASPLWYLTKP